MKLSFTSIFSLCFLCIFYAPLATAGSWTGTQVVKYSANFTEPQMETAIFYAKKLEIINFMNKNYAKGVFAFEKMSNDKAVLSLMNKKKVVVRRVFIYNLEAPLVPDPKKRNKILIRRDREDYDDCEKNLKEVEQEYGHLFDVEHIGDFHSEGYREVYRSGRFYRERKYKPCKFWLIKKIAEISFDFKEKKVVSDTEES